MVRALEDGRRSAAICWTCCRPDGSRQTACCSIRVMPEQRLNVPSGADDRWQSGHVGMACEPGADLLCGWASTTCSPLSGCAEARPVCAGPAGAGQCGLQHLRTEPSRDADGRGTRRPLRGARCFASQSVCTAGIASPYRRKHSACVQSCGRVVSSKLLRDQDGTTRGVGFVSFAAQEDATRAINDMDGRKVRGSAAEPPRPGPCPPCERQRCPAATPDLRCAWGASTPCCPVFPVCSQVLKCFEGAHRRHMPAA